MSAGKGDRPRPIADREQYRKNFDAIFAPKPVHDTHCCVDHFQLKHVEPVHTAKPCYYCACYCAEGVK